MKPEIVIPTEFYKILQKAYRFLDETEDVEGLASFDQMIFRQNITEKWAMKTPLPTQNTQIPKNTKSKASKEEDVAVTKNNSEKKNRNTENKISQFSGNFYKETPVALKNLKQNVAECRLCPLSKTRKNFIDFGGSGRNGLCLLTDIPDFYDQMIGFLLTDETRKLTQNMISKSGYNFHECYITSSVKCTSTKLLGSDLSPYKPCLKYLIKELGAVKPSFIIAMGEMTARLLFPGKEFREMTGKINHFMNYPVIFIHHPKDMIADPTLKHQTWKWLDPVKKSLP